MDYILKYCQEAKEILEAINKGHVEKMIILLKEIRERNGRLFFLGVGGSAANASHAVNDFRKICGFEAYTPMDNISELSARVNDEGWESVFVNWLKQSRLKENDALFVLSVGGGSAEKKISVNLIKAIDYAKDVKARILGIVGRDGGYTARKADCCIVIPPIRADSVTPHTESFQAVLWHLLVSHPDLKACEMKWESTK